MPETVSIIFIWDCRWIKWRFFIPFTLGYPPNSPESTVISGTSVIAAELFGAPARVADRLNRFGNTKVYAHGKRRVKKALSRIKKKNYGNEILFYIGLPVWASWSLNRPLLLHLSKNPKHPLRNPLQTKSRPAPAGFVSTAHSEITAQSVVS